METVLQSCFFLFQTKFVIFSRLEGRLGQKILVIHETIERVSSVGKTKG